MTIGIVIKHGDFDWLVQFIYFVNVHFSLCPNRPLLSSFPPHLLEQVSQIKLLLQAGAAETAAFLFKWLLVIWENNVPKT